MQDGNKAALFKCFLMAAIEIDGAQFRCWDVGDLPGESGHDWHICSRIWGAQRAEGNALTP